MSLIYPVEFPVATGMWQATCIFLFSTDNGFVFFSETNGKFLTFVVFFHQLYLLCCMRCHVTHLIMWEETQRDVLCVYVYIISYKNKLNRFIWSRSWMSGFRSEETLSPSRPKSMDPPHSEIGVLSNFSSQLCVGPISCLPQVLAFFPFFSDREWKKVTGFKDGVKAYAISHL